MNNSALKFFPWVIILLVIVSFISFHSNIVPISRRRLSVQEKIHEGLQFLRLDSLSHLRSSNTNNQPPPPSKATESHGISFLQPEKAAHENNPSIFSQAISFLDLHAFNHKEQPTKTTVVNERIKVIKPNQVPDDKAIDFLDIENVKKPKLPAKLPMKKVDSTIDFLDVEKVNRHRARDTKQAGSNIHFRERVIKPNPEALSHVKVNLKMDAAENQAKNAHPPYSPRPGSDISSANQMNLASCVNQSLCIVPELQLQKKYKIYFCKHPVRYGVRFYYLVREGLLLHPNVELLQQKDINKADYIVYLPGSAPWHKTECNHTSYAPKLIVLDELDFHTLFLPSNGREDYIQKYGSMENPWYFVYFKRSFVRRNDGKFQGYPHLSRFDTFPMVYAIAEAYLPHTFWHKREIDILCTLRGSKQMATRLRVQNWIAEYGKEREIKKVISGQLDSSQRTVISRKYFDNMFNSRIIVTVNPMEWEGDFRLWEAMGSGALVFVDPLFVPHPFPLIDKEHVIYFNNRNRSELFEKLDYYRSHPDEARRIALNGYFHAMKYHRTVNLIDYALRTAHMKERLVMKKKDKSVSIPEYTYTGQYLNYMARLQEKMILKCDRPGLYEANGKIPPQIKPLTC